MNALEALEYAHKKKRVHGDIKLGNIFLPKSSEVRLGDFGVAKILDGSATHRTYPEEYERRLGSLIDRSIDYSGQSGTYSIVRKSKSNTAQYSTRPTIFA